MMCMTQCFLLKPLHCAQFEHCAKTIASSGRIDNFTSLHIVIHLTTVRIFSRLLPLWPEGHE